jgi:hypothetical protein
MTDFFFDLPMWFPIAMFVVAIGVFIYGNNRSNAQLRLASLGIVVLTIGLVALSYFVDTFEEKCIKRTHGIIAAVDAKDWNAVRSLMNGRTAVVGLQGADRIAERGQQLADEFGLKQARVLSTTTRPGSTGLLDVVVLVQHEFNVPTPPATKWVFQYEQQSDGILLSTIAPADKDGTAVEMNKRLR